MKINKVIFIICFLCSNLIFSQISRAIDTSYTVNSAFKKSIKKYPFIEIVKPQNFENITEKKEIIYKEIGGRKLHLDAYLNTSEEVKPAVVLLHGGGWKSGNKSHMKPLAQSIASKGYACFTVEYRLSPEAKYPAGIYDVKNAIQFIKLNADEFKINSDKVAILGCSSGGQMAALIGATNNNHAFEDAKSKYKMPSSVQAIIDIDGILAFKHPQSKEGKAAGLWLGGSYESIPEIWKNASALTHTSKNTSPILFINSQYERFHAGRDDMIKILNSHNIYTQVETIENSPHTFWLFHPWYNNTLEYIVKFLDKIFKES
ncbi:alpha/beta hydrolase [Lutibacter sp. B1]|uniref:alpha/beta hydrolase n=1 Tax=Lutibacter sp. B1 TaxID=2725996 RepID=UPI0014567ACD|nr:alpha/beta hydrolase [Lutibacter sp. B1]NLP58702.1 alpha/beta hydrolase [Lutibacter sp. B1]